MFTFYYLIHTPDLHDTTGELICILSNLRFYGQVRTLYY